MDLPQDTIPYLITDDRGKRFRRDAGACGIFSLGAQPDSGFCSQPFIDAIIVDRYALVCRATFLASQARDARDNVNHIS